MIGNQYVPDQLRKAAEIYAQRNALYKDNYKRFGNIMKQLFPEPVQLLTEADHNRFALFVQVVAKVTRYAAQFTEGGHPDSLDDASVYAMMLKEVDADLAAQVDQEAKVQAMREEIDAERQRIAQEQDKVFGAVQAVQALQNGGIEVDADEIRARGGEWHEPITFTQYGLPVTNIEGKEPYIEEEHKAAVLEEAKLRRIQLSTPVEVDENPIPTEPVVTGDLAISPFGRVIPRSE